MMMSWIPGKYVLKGSGNPMQSNQLFRKASLDHISSPEQLHDYLCMTSPRMWMLAAAIAALIIGLAFFAMTGNQETVLPGRAEIVEGYAFLTLNSAQKGLIEPGMTVRIQDVESKLEYVFQAMDEDENLVLNATAELALPDGVYDAEILVETRTPIQMLLN